MSFFEIAFKIFKFLQKDPNGFYLFGKAFVKGALYVTFYRLFRRNIRIKLPFFIFCKKIKICGLGSVFIDKRCSIFGNAFDRLTIVTLSPNAQVIIGKGCDLGGVTIRCHNRVEMGDSVLSANCLIQDNLFLIARSSLKVNEKNLAVSPNIWIGSGVWLAGQTIVLGGSIIGNGSVLSRGGVCCNYTIPENRFATGNPVAHSLSVGSINSFLRAPIHERHDC